MASKFRALLKQLVEAMFRPVPTRISPEQVTQLADERTPAVELRLLTDPETQAETES